MLNSTLLLLLRSFSASLLMLIGPKYYIMYCTGDMAFYFAQKLLRGDFDYWAISFDGFARVFVSILMRVIMKTIVDHTGLVQFRAPAELGGIYWSFNMLVAVVSPLAATKLYYDTIKAGEAALEEKIAWSLTTSLCTAWLLVFVLFLKLMKKKYRKTFFGFETGCEWAMSFFLKGDTDAKRVKPLRLNKHMWKKIEPQVKDFVLTNWDKWEEEKPEWFTEAWKSRLDDSWLSEAELWRQVNEGGGQRRRSSLAEIMGAVAAQGRRASATVVPEKGAEGN
jgi:hypothetical protein